ncbi:MAG: hypothetical protein HZC14_03205 [Candidatus Niyogibacteria bacterium]|nr:hypothetical protein [Candidatus Niyogibacteria bacterium]
MMDTFPVLNSAARFINDIIFGIAVFPWQPFILKLKIVALILSAIFISGIIYASRKAFALMQKKNIATFFDVWSELPVEKRASRWANVKKRLDSDNVSDWKFAILEADGILDDIMKKIGYRGETLGERLMRIEPSDFDSLQEVWAAHKVRNRIAHEAATYQISKTEAEQVIAYYEKGLKELEYIS